MKQVNIGNLTPAKAIHPGTVLKKELDQRGIKQKELAGELGIAATQLNDILRGKRNISAELAVLLEAALDSKAIYWMNLQGKYELNKAKLDKEVQKKAEELELWKQIKDYIPFSYFRKVKVLVDDKKKDIPMIFNIYGVNKVEELASVELAGLERFKKSSAHAVDDTNTTGWVQLIRFLAKQKKVKPFSFNAEDALITELKQVFFQEDILAKVKKILAKYGIIFIVQSKPDKVPVDGITFWLDKNPVIAVTTRYKRLDNLAFTILHELGHIFLHLKIDKKKQFIDDVESSKSKEFREETEANIYAENKLIPKAKWEALTKITSNFSSGIIKEFAKEVNIHPAIVLGRLKKEQNEYYRRRFSIDNTIY